MSGSFDASWLQWGRMLLVALGAVVGILGLADFKLGRPAMAVVLLLFGAMAVTMGATSVVFPGQLF